MDGEAEYATWYAGQASAKRVKRSKETAAAAETPAEASSIAELAEADGQQPGDATEISPGAGGAARSSRAKVFRFMPLEWTAAPDHRLWTTLRVHWAPPACPR